MEHIKVNCEVEVEVRQLKTCEYPRQVRWVDFNSETENILYGIQLGDKIICSCCGGIFLIDELNELARGALRSNWVEIKEDWISFENEMAGNW